VLGSAPAEIATALDVTPATIYSLLQRARQAVTERLPSRSQQANLRTIGDQRLRRLVERYVDAWDRGDVAAITALLCADATLSMPPRSSWYRGRDDIGAFFVAADVASAGRWRRVPIRVNGQIGFGTYGSCDDGPGDVAHAIEVLTVDRRGRIADITSFQTPELFARFGLPNIWGEAR
jgi:RNA polymerase sigma-70 factor, ECF subfamily